MGWLEMRCNFKLVLKSVSQKITMYMNSFIDTSEVYETLLNARNQPNDLLDRPYSIPIHSLEST